LVSQTSACEACKTTGIHHVQLACFGCVSVASGRSRACQSSITRASGRHNKETAIARPLPAGDGCVLISRLLHSACHRLTSCRAADFHPDPFYKVYSSVDEDGVCHRGHGPAGYYGAETSDCDSPISLINATFDWIRDELKDSIDFVIWTGDSARHDNDEKIPRNVQQVTQLNQLLVDKFYEVFGKDQQEPDDDPTNDLVIPVIPTFGNNDILPHNIFERGPNLWTRRYLDIWRNFIPEVQKHSFDQGGWFYVEAIPGHLAVVSLNSLYVLSCLPT